jgi:UPF0755 protein
MFVRLIRFFLLLIVAAAAFAAWSALTPVQPKEPVTLTFPAGASSVTIAQGLEQNGVIRNAQSFLLLHLLDRGHRLKAGEYRFEKPASAWMILRRLTRGDVVMHSVVIPEGYNTFEIAAALEKAGLGNASDFLKVFHKDTELVASLDPAAPSLEGYLFPDTYSFTRTQKPHEIAAIMVRRFLHEARAIGLEGPAVHKTVTLASIVEKESAKSDERAHIAGLYSKRLSQNMPLDADPTVIYAALLEGRNLDGAGKKSGEPAEAEKKTTIYRSDLRSSSAYNTYKNAGLPPGPIACPGRASLEAAMRPEATNDLYFVAVGDNSGRHRFSPTYAGQEKNVAAYRRTAKK